MQFFFFYYIYDPLFFSAKFSGEQASTKPKKNNAMKSQF